MPKRGAASGFRVVPPVVTAGQRRDRALVALDHRLSVTERMLEAAIGLLLDHGVEESAVEQAMAARGLKFSMAKPAEAAAERAE